MIGATTTTTDKSQKIAEATDRAVYENVKHAAFSIAKAARKSMRNRRAIRIAMIDQDEAVVGTMYSAFGTAGQVLEHGGRRGETAHMEPRPFMGPAMESKLDRFADSFVGSIGE